MTPRLFRPTHFLLCALLAVGARAPLAADNVVAGMVLDLQGRGQVTDAIGWRDLQLLANLKPDMKVTLEPGSKASISLYASRSVYQVAGPAVLEITKDNLIVRQGAAPQVKPFAEQLALAAEKLNLASGAVRMRGMAPPAAPVRLLSPGPGSATLDTRPRFTWNGPAGANYTLVVRNDSGPPLFTGSATESQWELPAGRKLDLGKTYLWTVSTTAGADGEASSATGRFTVPAQSTVDMLMAAKPGANATLEERTLYAVMLESWGITDQSKAIWRGIAADRPDLEVAKQRAQ